MTKKLLALLAASTLTLAACATPQMSQDAANIAGVAGGAAAGLILADELDADDDWRLIGALAGAAAGTVVAQNAVTNRCAVARGDGTYYTVPCN